MLEADFLNSREITEYKVEYQFASKQNEVFLINTLNRCGLHKQYVLKIYTLSQHLKKEINFLTQLRQSKISVPNIEYQGKHSLLLELIPGNTLCQVFEQAEAQQLSLQDNLLPLIFSLCDWLHSFYNAAKKICGQDVIMGDINLRNFIITDSGICGLDFEDYRSGKVEEDAGRMCAYMLTYTPPFTPYKMDLVSALFVNLVARLKLDIDLVRNEMIQELDAIEMRRDISLPEDIGIFIPNMYS